MTQIGFIGAGQMAQALAAGIGKSNRDIKFLIADPSADARTSFANQVGADRVSSAESNRQVLSACEIVFLAVKPQYLEAALEGALEEQLPKTLLVSVMAGVRSDKIRDLTQNHRIIRVMPNTPCLIGQGAAGMAVSDSVSEEEANQVHSWLESTGVVVRVPESMLDAVTGLSGSGPAYVFTFIESLIQGAVLNGIPASTAQQLALQTVIGAARMVLETGEHPAVLRDRVSSPGGTTISALKTLEEKGFSDAVMSAISAATEKSKDLAG